MFLDNSLILIVGLFLFSLVAVIGSILATIFEWE
jgi:hypothetical protein